jgi:hypothetical protein
MQETSIPILIIVFQFLYQSDSLELSNFIGNQTFLEDE